MNKQVDDINVLLPNREVVIQGEKLTVREYTLNDTMALYPEITAFTSSLAELLGKSETVPMSSIEPIFARHYDSVVKLIARSIDQPIEYVQGLDGSYGMMLIDVWWTVNASFFINTAARKLFQQAAEQRNTVKSSPHLSSTDTMPNASNTTPGDK